jgi:hypothetical protein
MHSLTREDVKIFDNENFLGRRGLLSGTRSTRRLAFLPSPRSTRTGISGATISDLDGYICI